MERSRILTMSMLVTALWALPALAETVPSESQPSTEKVGYPEHDACFGDRYEADEDLKTGNEELVEKLLQELLNPGT